MQDHYADLVNLSQNVSVGSLAVGEAGLSLLRFAAGILRLTGQLRVDSVVNAISGFQVGGSPLASTHLSDSASLVRTSQIAGVMPTGAVIPFAGPAASIPSGWLACDGSVISRTTYAALFAVIGTTYGAGDGSTTFALPDAKGRVIAGKAASGTFAVLGATGGEEFHTLITNEIPAHSHTGTTGVESNDHTHSGTTNIEDATHSHTYSRAVAVLPVTSGTGSGGQGVTWDTPSTSPESANHRHTFATGGRSAVHTHSFTSADTGGGGAHNNLQPYIVMNHIIKT